MSDSRTTNSIRNSSFLIIKNIANILFGFIYRTIFVMVLSKEYLGLNGLFSNILSVLSIAELGISAAINFRLYKPVSIDDRPRIIKLMNFYKRVYFVIALTITVIGLTLMPFLNFLIVDKSEIPSDINLYILYVLFLFGEVSTYICIYKQSIVIANQKEWIISLCTTIGNFAKYSSMIIVLFITKNFTLVLVAQIFVTLAFNVIISLIADHLYPFMKSNKKDLIDKEERKCIYKETSAILNHRIGGVLVNSTDNILISSFIGLGIVGLYSNYNLIITAVSTLTTQVVASLAASIGNLFVTSASEKEKVFQTYTKIQYINVFITTYIMVSFCLLINNFIELWLGTEYLLSMPFVIIVTYVNILKMYRAPNNIFVNSCGLYMKDKWRPIIEVIVNLVISIMLVKHYGLSGIFIGTAIGIITVPLWREYYILNKYVFKSEKIGKVPLFKIIVCIGATLLGLLYFYLFSKMPTTLGWFILKVLICLITIPVIFILLTLKMPENKYLLNLISKILKRK